MLVAWVVKIVPTGKEFDKRRAEARALRLRVARALTGSTISDDALIIGIGGRMEMRNKGIYMYLETMARLNACEELTRDVVALSTFPLGPIMAVATFRSASRQTSRSGALRLPTLISHTICATSTTMQ